MSPGYIIRELSLKEERCRARCVNEMFGNVKGGLSQAAFRVLFFRLGKDFYLCPKQHP